MADKMGFSHGKGYLKDISLEDLQTMKLNGKKFAVSVDKNDAIYFGLYAVTVQYVSDYYTLMLSVPNDEHTYTARMYTSNSASSFGCIKAIWYPNHGEPPYIKATELINDTELNIIDIHLITEY